MLSAADRLSEAGPNVLAKSSARAGPQAASGIS